MNNFFGNQAQNDNEIQNRTGQSSNAKSSADINRAVIMPGSNESKNIEDDDETQLDDLAKQLNDTSFFAGNNQSNLKLADDIQLPDNLNFFNNSCEDAA